MLLDPFTIGAQVLNFLLLVWLLRRVLYGPITRAMQEREDRIRHEIEDARRLRAEAEAERAQHQQQVAAFAADQETRMAAARAELEAWRDAQTEAARQEIEARRERWQAALEQERKMAAAELKQRVGREILSLLRRALRDLADTDLEARMTARFLDRLRNLDPIDRARLLDAAREDSGRVHLRTAHPLSDDDRAKLGSAVSAALGGQLVAQFETAPEIGSGVELRAGGLKVAWSLNEYLARLDERLVAAFSDAPTFEDEHA